MDTFERRLQQFIEMEGLNQARFADLLGIQRGGLSHLLSGRNKPSFDFLTKLMDSYPALNAEWLIAGRGKPYKDSGTVATAVSASAPATTAPVPLAVANNSTKDGIVDIPDDLPDSDLFFEEPIQQGDIIQEPIPQPIISKMQHSQPSENQKSASRTITRLTIFYSDGTYEDR